MSGESVHECSEPGLLETTGDDGRGLLDAAATDWSRPVPHCPGWDAAQLVGHMGGIFAWIDRVVTTGEAVSRRDREVPPAGFDQLADWYLAHLDATLLRLRTTDPEGATWTFSSRGVLKVGWWRRRLAVETAIHRWDAQHAELTGIDGLPSGIDRAIAAAGVDEFLDEFLPGLLAAPTVEGLNGTLQLEATDSSHRWLVDLDVRNGDVQMLGGAKADTTIRGTSSDLLLWLTNRQSHEQLEVSGPVGDATEWGQLRR